jgi:hypothetical protein
MIDLDRRLQELADAADQAARPPGSAAAIRRGRRRRRRQVGGVVLVVVALAAGAVAVGRAGQQPGPAVVAPPTTRPLPRLELPQGGPYRFGRPSGKVVAHDEYQGIPWRYLVSSSKRQVCDSFQWIFGTLVRTCTPRPVEATVVGSAGTGNPAAVKVLHGLVARAAVRVRLTLKQGSPLDLRALSLPRVELATIDPGPGFPARAFVTVIPGDASLAQVETFDAAGRPLCRTVMPEFDAPGVWVGAGCNRHPPVR